jgi:hypothetical protein
MIFKVKDQKGKTLETDLRSRSAVLKASRLNELILGKTQAARLFFIEASRI